MANDIKVLIKVAFENKQFNKGVLTSSKKLSGMMGVAKAVGASLKANLGGMAIRAVFMLRDAFVDAIKVTALFKQQIMNAAAISGAALEDLEKVARKAAVATLFTAQEAAAGLTELARAGLRTADDFRNALIPALRLAQLGSLSVARASKTLVDTMAQFNIPFSQANMVVGTLIKSANSATTSVAELSQALKFGAQGAGLFNVSFKDTMTILSDMANQGIKAGIAGRAMRSFYIRLAKDLPAVNKALAGTGVSLKELRDAASDPVKLFQKLAPLLKSNSKAAQILGTQGLSLRKTIMSLSQTTADGSTKFEQFRKQISGTQKDIQALEDKQLSTLEGQLGLLKSAFQELQITLVGDSGLADALKDTVKDVASFIRHITELIKAGENLSIITTAWNTLVLMFKVGFALISPIFGYWILQIELVTTAIGGLAAAIGFLFSGQFAAAGVAVTTTLTTMKDKTIAYAKSVKDNVLSIGTAWKDYDGKMYASEQKVTKRKKKSNQAQVANQKWIAQRKLQIDKESAKKSVKTHSKAETEKTKKLKAEYERRLKLQKEYEKKEAEGVTFGKRASGIGKIFQASRQEDTSASRLTKRYFAEVEARNKQLQELKKREIATMVAIDNADNEHDEARLRRKLDLYENIGKLIRARQVLGQKAIDATEKAQDAGTTEYNRQQKESLEIYGLTLDQKMEMTDKELETHKKQWAAVKKGEKELLKVKVDLQKKYSENVKQTTEKVAEFAVDTFKKAWGNIFDTVVAQFESNITEIESLRDIALQELDDKEKADQERKDAEKLDAQRMQLAEELNQAKSAKDKELILEKEKNLKEFDLEQQANAAKAEQEKKLADAKQKINDDADKRVTEQRRKQAEAERAAALFGIAIDTAVGVVKALGSSPPPFNFINAGLVGAAGLVQAGLVTSQPLQFADGGRPPVGVPSIVGERGAEMFVPDSAGTIIPNHAMGGTNNFYIDNLELPNVSNVEDMMQSLQDLAQRQGKNIIGAF